MRWRGRRQSSNVEDQRSDSGGSSRNTGYGRGGRSGGGFRRTGGLNGVRRASGGSIKGLVILAVIYFAAQFIFGIDLMKMLGGGGGATTEQTRTQRPQNSAPSRSASKKANDELGQFAGIILAETEDVWRGIFKSIGKKYPEPKLVLFTNQVKSACGFASSASGPFYCPGDNKLYIDLSFFGQLKRDFGASGDFAQAYVLAHEVGHHVQNVIGVLPKFNEMRRTMSKSEANKMSVRVELQADCFAGIWGYYTAQKGLLERGDLEEALNAATQIGDDAIQKRTRGYVVPESFNHGTSEQRKRWFRRGFESGRLDKCNSLSAKAL